MPTSSLGGNGTGIRYPVAGGDHDDLDDFTHCDNGVQGVAEQRAHLQQNECFGFGVAEASSTASGDNDDGGGGRCRAGRESAGNGFDSSAREGRGRRHEGICHIWRVSIWGTSWNARWV